MPIRINLLAEQQAAEEARRKDPVKRGIIAAVAVSVVFLVWTLMVHVQLRTATSSYALLESEAKKIEDKAKPVKAAMMLAGDYDKRVAALERYSTNRVLWASMLDAMQRSSPDQVRFKQLATHQNFTLIATNTFVTTNISVPWTPPPASWKFWAGPPASTPYLTLASNELKTLTNGGAFLTNKLPYKIAMSVAATNEQNNTVTVKTTFTLPWVSMEDADVVITGREYGAGAPPTGTAINELERAVLGAPYFQTWLAAGDLAVNRIQRDPPTNPRTDPMEPNAGPFLGFQVQFNYKKRALLNE